MMKRSRPWLLSSIVVTVLWVCSSGSALAMYDDTLNGGNEDGRIDSADDILDRLQLWADRDHNGVSESTELGYLADSEVEWLVLYRPSDRVDRYGNEIRYRGRAGLRHSHWR